MTIQNDLKILNNMKSEIDGAFDRATRRLELDLGTIQGLAKTFAELALKSAEIESTPAYKEEIARKAVSEHNTGSAPEQELS